MNPDELQEAWRTQVTERQLVIDENVLLQQVQRNQKNFEATIFWRDAQEIGVALIMVPLWVWIGRKFALPGTWYLCIPALLWIAAFLLVDRIRQRKRMPRLGEPLRGCAEASLVQVEHQIWLLRNVFWWYLLPPGIPVAAFFAHCAWNARDVAWLAGLFLLGSLAFEVLVLWGVYWLNQKAVREELEPRRNELLALIENLDGGCAGKSPPTSPGVERPNRTGWTRVFQIVLFCAAAASLAFLVFKTDGADQAEKGNSTLDQFCPASGDAALTNVLVPIRQKYKVPAIAAALVTSKGLVSVGVAGTRKRGTKIPATLDDKWHLGSDAKAMTAMLVARLIERGRLDWDTTVAEVFPDLVGKFHPEMRKVTILHLLTHRSGLRPNLNLASFQGDDLRGLRLRAVREELAKPPRHPPGKNFEYSNLGYVIAGAIVERITDSSWEDAIRTEIFLPLDMKSAGFGGTGTPGQIDQPWPHNREGNPMPTNGPGMDNPPVMGPAGRVHCTIQDWGKFITDQLRGSRGEAALLKAASYQRLHTPSFGGDYALGWLVTERSWGGGTVLNHGGDNTMNFANVWVAPERDFGILVCVNQSGDIAFKASDEAVGALISLRSAGKNRKEEVGEP